MIEFTIDTEVGRPIEDVFAFVVDPSRLPEWQTNTVSAVPVEPGPLVLGSRIREVHRGPGGKELESLVEVSELEADRVFALRMVEGPLPIHGRIAFERAGPVTLVHFTVQGEPSGLMRLLQPVLAIGLKRQFREHCSNLKRVLEEPQIR